MSRTTAIHLAKKMSNNTITQTPPDPCAKTETIAFRQRDLHVIQSLGHDSLGYAWLVIEQPASANPPALPADGSQPEVPVTEDPVLSPTPLVLKTIVGMAPRDPAGFEREFQTLARLDHPGLARFRQLEITPDGLTYTRDYTEALDFLSYLRRPATERERHDLRIRLNDDEATHLHTTDVDLTSPLNAPIQTGEFNVEPSTIELDLSDVELEPVQTSFSDDLQPHNNAFDTHAPLDLIFLRLEHILPQLLSVLEYLHRFRRVHGNLTPENIQIDANGILHVSDFGLRRLLQSTKSHTDNPSKVQPENIPPNISELAIEQADDLHALGCLLFDAIAPPRPANLENQRDSLLAVQPHCPATWIELVQDLLHAQPALRPGLQTVRRLIETSVARAVALPPTRIDEQSTFFGRNEILDSLLDTAKKTTATRDIHFVLLTGQVGTGKAALLDLLAYRSAQTGWLVLRGPCYQGDVTLYQGFSEVANQLAALCKQLPENVQHKIAPIARRAARLFPCLTPTNQTLSTTSQASSTGEPCTSAARLFAIDALRQLLAIISEQRPVLICLDDLQHANDDTLALLADLVGSSESLRCMIAASACNNASSNPKQRIYDVFRTAPVQPQHIELPVFTRHEARQYIIGSARTLPFEKQKEILKNGHLHPLLIDELIFEQQRRLSNATKSRNIPDEQLELSIGSDSKSFVPVPSEAQIPHNSIVNTTANALTTAKTPPPPVHQQLTNLYKTRLAALSRAERLVLQLLTVAYAPLSADLLTNALLTELGSQQFAGQSGALIAEKLVRLRLANRQAPLLHNDVTTNVQTELNASQNASYLPPHDIVRQIVLDDIGRDHHAHLCSLIADIFCGGKRPKPSPHAAELRFEYLVRATRRTEACDAAPDLARAAEQRFAFHRAAEIWRWHLGHTTPKRIQSTDCLPNLARTEARAGNFDEAAHHYQSIALALQTSAENTPENQIQRARFHLYEADSWIHAGHAANAVTALNAALAVFSESYTSSVLRGTMTGLKVSILSNFSRSRIPAARMGETTPNAANAAERIRAEIYQFTIDYNAFLNSTRGRSMQNRLARLAKNTRDTYLNALDRVGLVPEIHVPSISFAPVNPSADLSADLALSATLFEQIDNPGGLATVAYAHGLRSKRRYLFTDAVQHLERAATQCARADTDTTSLEFRITYALARLHFDHGKLAESEKIARQLLHSHRHDQLAKLRAHQLITDVCLLRGKIDQAALSLHHTATNAAALDTSFVHIEIARQSARINIAKGRPEVAAGHLDMLIDQLHITRLNTLAPSRLLVELTLGQALAALLERQRILEEPRQEQTQKRLAKTITSLHNQRHLTITPALSAEITRLRARYELLRNKPLKALRELTTADACVKSTNTALEIARHEEARAIITLRLDNLDHTEKTDARTALENARSTYNQLGASLPLLLEGWPNIRTAPVVNEEHA